jgi:hypothetical protein
MYYYYSSTDRKAENLSMLYLTQSTETANSGLQVLMSANLSATPNPRQHLIHHVLCFFPVLLLNASSSETAYVLL